MSNTFICRSCKTPFEREAKRGRPAVKCPKCRGQSSSEDDNDIFSLDDDAPKKKEVQPTKVTLVSIYKASASEPVVIKEKPLPVFVPKNYCVMVGNMGQAYLGDDENEAMKRFSYFAKASSLGFGQVGFEYVQLWKLNKSEYEMVREHKPLRD